MVSPIDIAIVIGYLFLMLLIGFFVSRKEDLEGYFVNNRKTRTLMLLTTTISTYIGAAAIIGMVGIAYQYGIGMGIVFIASVFFGYLFVAFASKKIKSFGDRNRALTIGDFCAYRYSQQTRLLVAFILAMAAFFVLALQFVALGNMFSILTGWNFGLSLLIAGSVTAIYTALGGLKSDFYTDAIQFWLMLLIFILLVPLGLNHVGGLEALKSLPPTHFDLFTFGGPLVFFGGLLFTIPILLVGMDVWQRVYAAADEKTARKTFLLASFITPIFYVAATILGLIAALSFTGIDGDMALFKLMDITLPAGLFGIGLVSLLAIVMSSVDSLIVILSAIFTKDFYKSTIKPSATNEEMLKIGRIISFVVAGMTLLLAFFAPSIIQLAIYNMAIAAVAAPTLIGGLFWKKSTNKAAFLSIVAGLASALVLVQLFKESGAVIAAIISTLIFVVVSYLTEHSKTEHME